MFHSLQKSLWKKDAISVEGLDIKINATKILEKGSFSISTGDRIVLLGRNGCGKSTLLHWLSTNKESSWSVYEVAQELASSSQSILQIVLSAHLERGSLYARQAALEEKDDMTQEEAFEYNEIAEQLVAMKAEADPPRAKKILAGLGFRDFHASLNTFSGGWRARVALAQGLFMEPDLLMLDEPTNHLDLEAVLWLTGFCESWNKTLLVISHNVGFVREIAKTIWHLNAGKLVAYKGSYTRFLKQQDLALKKQASDWAQLEKDTVILKKKGKEGKKQLDLLLAKRALEGVTRPEKPYAPKFFLRENAVQGGDTAFLTTEEVCLAYEPEKPILENVSFAIYPGSRIALVGANGSGKSTLIKYFEGSLEAVQGSSSWRPGLRVCKFDQHFYSSLPEEKTPIEFLERTSVPLDFVRKVLGASGLSGEAQIQKIGSLSGGQKARVYFASISIQAPDILLLDEPTNHLDIETIQGLQNALQSYPGAAVVISHDLDFLEEIATEVWMVGDSTVKKLSEGNDGLRMYVESISTRL